MRCALLLLALVAAPAFAAPPELSELPGPLVLADGAKPGPDAMKAFVDLAGKGSAKIVVIANAKADAEAIEKQWKEYKPESVTVLQKKNETAVAAASGIWVADAAVADKDAIRKAHGLRVVIGGDAIALGLLPGFHSESEPKAGLVGLSLEPEAAIVIRGRVLRVIGEKPVTVRLARGAGYRAQAEEAKAGAMFDLYQLRRAAANRAEKDFFPPAKPAEPVVAKGSLVIIGGGGTTQQIMDAFFTAAGGKDALIVVIPTTEKDGPGDSGFLRRYGATNVKTLFTKDHKLANDPQFSEMLTKAGGVWFGGGRQWNFVDSFEGTLVEKRFHDVLERGGAIGGSSAGASIQSEYMPRGHPLGNTVMAAEGYEKGFGFLPGCAVDQHFFARDRTADMTGLMKLHPQYLGIGIDEATAIVVTGSKAEVMGRGSVGFYDTRKPTTRLRYSWSADGRLVWEKADFEELFPGEKYDLQRRMKIK